MTYRVSPAPHAKSTMSTQSIMAAVLVALSPCVAAAAYWFGWRALLVVLISVVSCVLFELLAQIIAKRPITISDYSAAVTGVILALNLPVTAPWWMIVIGAGFAILIVKQLFGGLGCNFLNPALAARAVLLASWPSHMTNFTAPLGIQNVTATDAVSSATYLAGGYDAGLFELFIGKIPGSLGEVCKLAILVGLIYLLIRKVITIEVPASFISSFMIFAFLFGLARNEYATTAEMFLFPLEAVLSGGVLFGAVFMATDYVTNPMTTLGRIIFGIGCGLLVAVIRFFGSYPEGVTYAILLMNIVTPLIDRFVRPRVYGEVRADA